MKSGGSAQSTTRVEWLRVHQMTRSQLTQNEPYGAYEEVLVDQLLSRSSHLVH